MSDYKALWHINSRQSEIKTTAFATNKQLKIKSLFSLISLGTEKLVASGKVPLELHQSMKIPYQAGDFSFPVKYGYSLVGEVISEQHPLFGKRVHLLHPHQNFCLVDEKDVFPIPAEVDSQVATLASNMETALNAVWDSGLTLGDRILIVGFGLIGSLIARLVADIPGTEVEILDIDLRKVELARSLGFNAFEKAAALNPQNYDLAFHCSAKPAGLQVCLDKTGFESKIIELSWYGNQPSTIQLGGTFHQQRKQLISSQVAYLPPGHRGRWDYQRRKELIFNLLKMPIFKHHISQTLKFADVPKFFNAIRADTISELGVCIDYQEQ